MGRRDKDAGEARYSERRKAPLRRRARLGWVACALAVALALPPSSLCQAQVAPATGKASPGAASEGAYRALIAEAIREYSLRNYAEARSLFTRAYGMNPNARVMRGLGMAEFELRNYIASTDLLTQALASNDKPLTAAQRKQTIELLQRAQSFIGRFSVELSPPQATLQVDGAPVDTAAGNRLLMQVGDHTIEVSAPGFRPTRRIVKVTGGELATIRVQLEAVSLRVESTPPGASPGPTEMRSSPATSPPTEPSTPNDGSTMWESPWLWAGAGAVLVGVGAVLVVALAGGETVTASPVAGGLNATLGAP